jgi:hypothetical protein
VWRSRTCWPCIGVRTQLLKQRIAFSNQMRALLHERGVAARLGAAGLRQAVAQALKFYFHTKLIANITRHFGEGKSRTGLCEKNPDGRS